MNTAYFAGGCFWCITPDLRELPGVTEVISGYCGGDEVNPTYDAVKHQLTGHRETIAVHYDPSVVSYAKLIDTYLRHVDPFDGEGQFIDRGYSYTLAIYYANAEERRLAQSAIQHLESVCEQPVRVALEPLKTFWPAEEYHQNYDLKNPEAFARELVESGRKK